MVSREAIIEVLKTVEDPELLLDVWFLGLIYNIDVSSDEVKIQMTFTSPACPYGPELLEQVKSRVAGLEGVKGVDVEITFTPAWEPSDDVKAMLGMI